MAAQYVVKVLTPEGVQYALPPTYIELSYAKTVNAVGAATLKFLVNDKVNAAMFPENTRIQIWRSVNGAPAYLDLEATWFVTRNITTVGSDRKKMLEIGARSALDLVNRRIVASASGSSGATIATYADDEIKRIVSEQIANNATIVTGRPGLSAYMTVAPNVSKGASANKQVGWRNCLQAIQEMARDSEGNGTPIYYDVVTTAGGMEFRTWISQPGVDRRTTTSLSLENGTLRSAAWGFDRENAVTVVYGLGQEFSGARQQVLAADTSNIRNGFDVRETSVDARNATLTSELADEASAELQRRKAKTFVSAEIANVQAALYGVHWNYGDRVTVVVDGVGYGALIEGVQIQVDSNGAENVRATLRY